MTLPNTKTRLYLYGVVSVALTVLVAYKLIDAEAVPMWLNVAATILGVATTSTAGVALAQQRKTGEVEPTKPE